MKRFLFVLLLAVVAAACGGRGARSPRIGGDLSPLVTAAFREEATGDPEKAIDLWARALESASLSPDNPASVAVLTASLDALVHRDVDAFSEVARASALFARVPKADVDERLAKIDAEGPFAPGLIATARLELAERRGDAKAAAQHRAKTGCVREAALVGPVSFQNALGPKEASNLDKPGVPFPAEVAGASPFAPRLRPQKVNAFGCFLPLYAHSSAAGVREVIVDLVVEKAGVVGIALRSEAAATLRAGGQLVIDRPHALGLAPVTRFARIHATDGVLRVVVRAGMVRDFGTVQISAWDEDGKPLVARAPATNRSASATVRAVLPVEMPAARTDAERLTAALGALAQKDVRAAENLLHPQVARADVPPELLLAYARAVRAARDLPSVKAYERARSAYDRVLEAWPGSWEATVEHAVLAGARRGRAEATIEALADLDKTRSKSKASTSPILDAWEAAAAGRERLYDRARAAFERAKGPLAGTPLLREVERAAFERTGVELAQFDCANDPTADRSGLACHHALVAVGDRAGGERELERLRGLAETPQLYLSLSSRNAVEAGDLARAGKILDAMNPADRPLSTIYAVKGKAALPELYRHAPIARDAPGALPGLLRAAGDDPLAPYAGVAEKVVADGGGGFANAATAVLLHEETYDVEPSGLVHFVMIDVRRVMGTTDVEANAQASAPMIFGRDTMRILRRRIFKKDGRIVLPDRTPNAAQSHADLSQLEAGDAIEAVYEGWGLPGATGNLGIDTPDLLPERTAVKEAKIELRLPPAIPGSLWSHPLLGKAEEKVEKNKRVLRWHVKNRGVRRIEAGVPKMDRNVMVSWSTATWDDVARSVRDSIATLDADSPEVSLFAREAAGTKTPSKELVEAVAAASGQAVKEASGIVLTDISDGHGNVTARTILATHEGSRTWLVARALRELGVPTDIVIAENQPFSDSPSFPPHYGRFMHPLAVAHVSTGDVWLDLDVPGPPLPAGRISPELRGRSALFPDGKIAPLPPIASESERDEIDIRLTVDDQGNAKGSLTVLLRGRSAQDVAEALARLVGLERQRALRGIALAWVPFATVEKVELSSTEGSWQVALRAELSAPAYAQVEGQKAVRSWVLPGMDTIHYVFPRPYVTTLGSTYATHGARENALAINHATQYHVRRRVELPAKAKIARLPGPFEGKGPLLSAQRKIAVAGNSIEEDFTLDLSTGTIPRDRYDTFVSEAHRTDDAFRASTRVTPP